MEIHLSTDISLDANLMRVHVDHLVADLLGLHSRLDLVGLGFIV